MRTKIFKNKESLNAGFTEWMKKRLSEKETITLSLSGGSTPKSLFTYWAERHKTDIDWSRVKFFWGDERCVPPTDEQSNYRMTKEHLFNVVSIPEKNIFRIHGENTPEAEAKRYTRILQNELDVSPSGVPSFDILMLGMGDDGHTASIFPHEIALWNSPEICVVGTHPESGQKRVSLSGKIINAATRIAFLVTGSGKAEKVKEIIAEREKFVTEYPAALVYPESGNLTWFLDEQAAQYL